MDRFVRIVVARGARLCYNERRVKYKCFREVDNVSITPKYYIVDAKALPEVFLKVAEAKRMLETGEAYTVGEATRLAEVSRSAFYKYKDMVMPFNNMRSGRILTFYTLLKDQPGVLSTVLAIFASSGANILTINQSIPTNGCAAVTISAETSEMKDSLEDLVNRVSAEEEIIRFEILAG